MIQRKGGGNASANHGTFITSKSSSRRRKRISYEVFEMAFSSYFVRFFALISTTLFAVLYSHTLHSLAVLFCFISSLLYLFFFWKQLVFESLVLFEVTTHKMGYFDWYNAVDDNLLLGAIPLEHLQHGEELQRMGVALVLSIVEPFELTLTTLIGKPVPPEYWKKQNIDHIILSSPDFFPPRLSVLDEGARVLDEYLREGRRVYVHCKSGKGRSASVVLAYFAKYRYRNMSLYDTCYPKLKSRRSAIFNSNSPQMRQMKLFIEQQQK